MGHLSYGFSLPSLGAALGGQGPDLGRLTGRGRQTISLALAWLHCYSIDVQEWLSESGAGGCRLRCVIWEHCFV